MSKCGCGGGHCTGSCDSGGCKNKATHSHTGKQVHYCRKVDVGSCLKKYGIYQDMPYDDLIAKLFDVIDGLSTSLTEAKAAIDDLQDAGAPALIFITNGSSLPSATANKGKILIENATGDSTSSDGKTYYNTGISWVKGS